MSESETFEDYFGVYGEMSMKQQKRFPNVVIIMFDEMPYHAAGFAGSRIVQTPVMDKVAAKGVVFENAYCASPVCSPALMANYGPKQKGRWGYHLPDKITTIGDSLISAGYRCGMVGSWHMGNDETPQHGFTDLWC